MAAKGKARDPHPEEELRRLELALERGLPRGVVLRGAERYFRERGIELAAAAALAAGHELCRHDAKDPEFELPRLLDDLAGGALFASARCVVVANAGALVTKGSKSFSQGLVDALLARLSSDAPGVIVLGAETLRADNALAKAIVKADGVLVGCRKLWDTPPPWDPDPRKAELVQWLVARAREAGVKLAADEAAYVVAATGNDLAALDSQLARLRERGAAGVRELVGWDAGGSPWVVAEHLCNGDARRAAAGLESLYAGGFQGKDGTRTVDAGGLTAMLVNAVTAKTREALHGASALARGESMDDAASAAGIRGGPTARRSFEARVRRRPLEEWRRMLDEIGELESRSHSGATVDANDFALLVLRWRVRGKG